MSLYLLYTNILYSINLAMAIGLTTYTCPCTHMYRHTQTHTHTHTHTNMPVWFVQKIRGKPRSYLLHCTYICTYTHTHVQIHTYTHTYMYTHINSNRHMQNNTFWMAMHFNVRRGYWSGNRTAISWLLIQQLVKCKANITSTNQMQVTHFAWLDHR